MTASAQNTGFYAKVDLGGNITQDVEVREFFGTPVGGGKLKLDTGFRAGVGGGFQVTDWFAPELELGFTENRIHSINVGSSHVHDAWFGNVPFLVNAKFQLPISRCPVTPYVGVGAGFSETIFDADFIRINDVSISGNDADTVFAWQAFAGLRFAINEQMGVGLEYRYFEADPASFHADFAFGTPSDVFSLGRTHTHSLSAVFNFRF